MTQIPSNNGMGYTTGDGEAAINQEGEALMSEQRPEDTRPCPCRDTLHCPECGAHLQDTIGVDYATDTIYDALKCPQGCNLWPYFT